MANGFSNEQMLEIIMDSMKDNNSKLDKIQTEFSFLNANGCAQRKNDLERLASLEANQKKGIYAILTIAGGVIMNFFGIRPH